MASSSVRPVLRFGRLFAVRHPRHARSLFGAVSARPPPSDPSSSSSKPLMLFRARGSRTERFPFSNAGFSTSASSEYPEGKAASGDDIDEIDISFLDPNNPPDLTDEQVGRLSEDGWKNVKPVYPENFRTIMDEVATEGVPDYSQLRDLASAFTKTEPIPYVVDKDLRSDVYVKNPCILCDHFQVKMCEKLNKIEYTNTNLINKFINERGMINSRRVNGTCPKAQRHMAWLIKRCRNAGLISYTERWQPPITFMQKMNWFETDVRVEPREYTSKRKGRRL